MENNKTWIEDLLDLGIGKLAEDTLYRIENKIHRSLICPRCGTVPGKHATQCPKCRKDLPFIKDIGGKLYIIKDP